MNDRLKFRVWDIKNKKMIGNADFLSFDYDCDMIRIRDRYLSINEIFNLKYDKIIIEQSTGLKDKNGKLIFENDVVKADIDFDLDGRVNLIRKVIFNKSAFCLEYASDILEINKYHNIEVIGNIHQDSHLLGGK